MILGLPRTHRVRVEGRLDMVKFSDATFNVLTDSGRNITGQWVNRSVEELVPLLNQIVVFLGIGEIDFSGNVISIRADGVLPSQPAPTAPTLTERTKEERDEMARRLKSALGQWPGDETDEQVNQALEEMR